MPTTCSKLFGPFAAAHRQHRHDGHCALIHGHNFSFEITFAADSLDENQFVIDFGKLKWLRAYLEELFDHTLLLNADDPALPYLRGVLDNKVRTECGCDIYAHIIEVPSCGAEGLGEYLLNQVNIRLTHPGFVSPEAAEDYSQRCVRVVSVTVFEDEKNKATYVE